jgi:hypothetical protein
MELTKSSPDLGPEAPIIFPLLYLTPVIGFLAAVTVLGTSPVLTSIPFLLAAIALWVVLARNQPRFLWTTWRNACLKEGWCPACGYSLAGAPSEDDGCTVCSECGAAWFRLPPHLRP